MAMCSRFMCNLSCTYVYCMCIFARLPVYAYLFSFYACAVCVYMYLCTFLSICFSVFTYLGLCLSKSVVMAVYRCVYTCACARCMSFPMYMCVTGSMYHNCIWKCVRAYSCTPVLLYASDCIPVCKSVYAYVRVWSEP